MEDEYEKSNKKNKTRSILNTVQTNRLNLFYKQKFVRSSVEVREGARDRRRRKKSARFKHEVLQIEVIDVATLVFVCPLKRNQFSSLTFYSFSVLNAHVIVLTFTFFF